MKILYINNKLFGGGAQNVFRLSYLEMKKIFSIYMATTEESKEIKTDVKLENSNSNLKKILFNYKNYKIINTFIKNNEIDIVHLHNYISELSPSILLALKRNKKKIKIVQTLHQFDFICPNSSLSNMKKGIICEKCIGEKIKWNILKEKCSYKGRKYDIAKFLISLEKYFFNVDKIIDYYIVPSDFSKTKMLEEGIKKEKIKVLKNFVDDKFWIEENNYNKKNNIVYFGRFSKEKNVILLLKSIEILKNKYPDIHLFIIGNGLEYENYIASIQKYKLQEYITVINEFLPSEKVKEILNEVKISVLPSKWYETFGLTIIESIYANVIPIATNIGAMLETINDSFGFTFKNEDAKDLANKIDNILINYDMYINELIRKKEDIRSNYYKALYCDKLKRLYNNI